MTALPRDMYESMAEDIRAGRIAPYVVVALLDMDPNFAAWYGYQAEAVAPPAEQPPQIGGASEDA